MQISCICLYIHGLVKELKTADKYFQSKMKKGLLFVILVCCSVASFAGHIAGGEIYYRLVGPGATANTNKYEITLRLFRECNPPVGGQPTAPLPTDVRLGIFNNTNPSSVFQNNITVLRSSTQRISLGSPNPCITNPPEVCYDLGYFVLTIDLPITPSGYIISFQTCCRTNGIANLNGNSQGGTYTGQIPGTSAVANSNNSSPVFGLRDTTLVCRNSPMTLDFSATDPDGDSLVYSFCSAYNGGDKTDSSPLPPTSPSYGTVSYQLPFTGSQPLGNLVTINAQTGIISGTAPNNPGRYVINVCISEYRNGSLISLHRKDFTLQIGDCTIAGAELPATAINCGSFTSSFQNESSATGIASYAWNFGDPGSGTNNTSSSPTPSHTFSDTGKFTVKLVVTSTGGCLDSAQTLISIYPDFKVGFVANGNCYQSPFTFQDTSKSTYGIVNSWRWDFGDNTTNADTSILKNPSYQYPSAGIKDVRLIATCTKGCIDTALVQITVRENPLLNLPFKDTLICSIDDLPLRADGTGNFSWIAQPADPSLTTPNAQNPIVSPNDTTRYIVTLNDNGCIKKDTINVNVLDFISINLGQDTGICRTDTIVMNPVSHALSYQWSPATGLSDTTTKFPQAFPNVTTTYFVQANLGLCPAYDTITIQVAPYPVANAGPDSTVCYGDRAQLNGSFVGTGFAWSPVNTLQNPTSLNPIAGPLQTTQYILTAFSQGICPKPKSDTVIVVVRPKVNAFAGNDTAITALQPLLLNATGGATYTWTPSLGLSASNISNPIATLPATVDSIIYRVRAFDIAGCFSDDDMKVIVFKTGPEIFIPTGFTPNGDGNNEIVRPVLVGMQKLNYFRVYNRWGQMIFSTSEIGKGWDGRVGGVPQPSGTYVFAAQAIDYTGKVAFRKGTVVLIR
jgi:gliding motility-associated-like protein